MNHPPDTSMPSGGEPAGSSAQSANPPSGARAQSAPARRPPTAIPGLPSFRISAALAAVMLTIGVVVGAAIGPSPTSSLAGTSNLALVLRALGALEAARQAAPAPASEHPAAPAAPSATVATAAATNSSTAATSATPAPAAVWTSPPPGSTGPVSSTPRTSGAAPGAKLPPITSVWLIELSGEGFSQDLAQPAAAPYLTGQALPTGTLLSRWSTLDASAFASEAALLAGSPPQTLDTIAQPPCPEGAAGVSCAPGTPGAVSAADGFLEQVLPTITATAAYRAHGLIVITFSSVRTATETGLPAGAATATLSSQPPAGVLLISRFAAAGVRPSQAFDPTSPGKSVKALLHP